MSTVKYASIISLLTLITSTLMVVNAETTTATAPSVPFQYGVGVQNFQALCSECHGEWAEGSDKGPTLLHPYYRPSHHSDDSFYRAASQGVNAHHWRFGNMPPVEGATPEDIQSIILFIRWWQRENGIQ
jgi:cytochrome c2